VLVDLGWAVYGDYGMKNHRWEYNQRINLLRSFCHAVYRRTDNVGVLRVDDAVEKCMHCVKKEKLP